MPINAFLEGKELSRMSAAYHSVVDFYILETVRGCDIW